MNIVNSEVPSQKFGAGPLLNQRQKRHDQSSAANLPRNIEMIQSEIISSYDKSTNIKEYRCKDKYMQRVILQLEIFERTCLLLQIEGFSIQDIADIVEKSQEEVTTALHDAWNHVCQHYYTLLKRKQKQYVRGYFLAKVFVSNNTTFSQGSDKNYHLQVSQCRNYQRAKRLMDLTITVILLPFLGLLMLAIAVLIFLDSPGPIIYRQKRVGPMGVEFDFFKFRSMYVNNDDTCHRAAIQQFMNDRQPDYSLQNANQYKLDNDKRFTRMGKFLRSTSLDELPQFFNVLLGTMSLVGPRPPLSYEVECYSSHDKLRLSGKPGLTGIWQVYGRSRVSFNEMINMDVKYLQTQSLLLDLKLILLTIPIIILGSGD